MFLNAPDIKPAIEKIRKSHRSDAEKERAIKRIQDKHCQHWDFSHNWTEAWCNLCGKRGKPRFVARCC